MSKKVMKGSKTELNDSKNIGTEPLKLSHLFSYILDIKIRNLFSSLILIVAALIVYSKNVPRFELYLPSNCSLVSPSPSTKSLTYWAYGKNLYGGHLKHVFLVLDRIGYKNETDPSNWDLLWAHDYPFRTLYTKLNNLQPHQKVNHFPGCGFITNKVDLSTSGLKYIPKAFKLPEQKDALLSFAKDNPSTVFIQKSNNHRGIKIQKLSTINLDIDGTFLQEYVDKPFLVDGYKFDIGVYTIITSVDPLRIYIYNGDILFRYCPQKYYPFDPENLDKYVVGDDYLPTWEVPSLQYYYNTLGFSMRDSFDAYVKSQNKNPSKIWEHIEESIRHVILNKEDAILKIVQRFKSKRNFFEMMRFDFVIDDNLNVYLMEANMSPNLSSAHYPPNQLLYEQVIYNLFSLVGVAGHIRKRKRTKAEESMMTADKNIVVFPEECSSETCRDSCMSPICQLCLPCLTDQTKMNLIEAYREHMNRMDCKRVFPPPMSNETNATVDLEQYSSENQLQYRWFLGKCLMDSSWC